MIAMRRWEKGRLKQLFEERLCRGATVQEWQQLSSRTVDKTHRYTTCIWLLLYSFTPFYAGH